MAAHYKRRIGFVTDLLEVEIQGLFSICLTKNGENSQEDEAAVHAFIQELQKFIVQNQLRHVLLSQMKEMLVRNVH